MLGKYRHLSRCSTAQGHFVILAIDHRNNLLEQLNRHAPAPITDADFTGFKQQVVRALAPESSGVLIDPAYGIGTGIASGNLPARIGLLSPVEVTDYGVHPSQRTVQMIAGWSIEKIKRVGGDGVKMLLYYHPGAADAEAKCEQVSQIVAECKRHDIPFFLEPIPYSLDPEKTLTQPELREVSIAAAITFSDIGVDVLKMPFPALPEASEAEWVESCTVLNAACKVPWALLSAGVDYATFLKQARVACEAGASGVIVGRAVWREAVALPGDARAEFIRTTAVGRMRELAAICAGHATTWHTRIEPPPTPPDWYERY